MTKKLRTKMIAGLGALFLMLLCFAFLFFSTKPARAEALTDNPNTTGITANYTLYNNGIISYKEQTLSRHTYITEISAEQMNQIKSDVQVDAPVGFKTMSRGMMYVIRSKNENCVKSLDTYRDQYIAGIASGGNYTGNTLDKFMDVYGEEIEYAIFTYDPETLEFVTETNSDLVFAQYREHQNDGSMYFETFFDITQNNVNDTFYYRSFFARRSTTKLQTGGLVPITTSDESITGLSNIIIENEAKEIKEIIAGQNYTDDFYFEFYNKLLGIYHEAPATINLNYKVYNEAEMSIVDKTLTIPFNSLYRNSPEILAKQLAKNLEGFPVNAISILQTEALPYFDVSYAENVEYKDEESGYTLQGISNEETRLVAKGIEFIDDFEDNDNSVDFNVIYDDFDHSHFYINLTNNEIENNLWLKINSGLFEIKGKKGYLTFDFNRIERQARTVCGWLFELGLNNADNFFTLKYGEETLSPYVTTVDGKILHRYTMEKGGLVVEILENEKLTVIYDLKEAEDVGNSLITEYTPFPKYDLFNLNIEVEAEIVPDEKVVFEYRYINMYLQDNKIVKEMTTVQATDPIWYSVARDFQDYNSLITNFPSVKNSINLPFDHAKISGAKEYTAGTSDKVNPETGENYKIYGVELLYTFTPVFRIRQMLPSGEETVRFLTANRMDSTYFGIDFIDEIPDGYRVSSIASMDNNTLSLSFADSWEKSKFNVNTRIDDEVVIDVVVNYSDTYNIELSYLQKYKNTPFGTYQKYAFELPVKDYSSYETLKKTLDSEEITLEVPKLKYINATTLEAILGFRIDSLNAGVKTITTENGPYKTTMHVSYNGRKVTQYYPDGGENVKTIPLTSFGDWCDALGIKWDILYLNTATANHGASTYFERADEVNPYDLYGFFTIASFSQKSLWKNITDVKLDSTYTVYTYFIQRYSGTDLGVIRDIMGAPIYGDDVEITKDKDYGTFFTFIDTNIAGNGFVSVDGVEKLQDPLIWFGESGGGCGCGMFSCENIGNLIYYVLIAIGALLVLFIVMKLFRR